MSAPYPWRIEDHTSTQHGADGGYLRIVDAAGTPICDFFPFAAKVGRGKAEALDLAREIIDRQHPAS